MSGGEARRGEAGEGRDAPDPGFDLDSYFARIGYEGPREASLAALNGIIAGHSREIPFENFDPLLGRPVALDGDSLQRKLVRDRRGYCFEQNGLLLLALEALGFDASPIGARVRIGRARDYTPPRTHLFARVEVDGDSWLADVGVGGLTPTAAIRLAPGVEQETPHEPRRIIREGPLYYHQALLGGEWQDVCEFTLEGMPPIDREVANWYTSAHLGSHFKGRILVARAAPSGVRLTLLDDQFGVRGADGRAEKRAIASRDEFFAVLAEHFGLRLDPDARFNLPAMPWLS